MVTSVSLTLTADADADADADAGDPDARGRVSPLTLRVYALKSSGPFEGAEFFSLFEKNQATLGAELMQRKEMLLRPGESKNLDPTLPADAKAIGVIAAFRNLDRARWREVRPVTPAQVEVLNMTSGARPIRVDPAR